MTDVYTSTDLNSMDLKRVLFARKEQITSFLLESPLEEIQALFYRLLNDSSVEDTYKRTFLTKVESSFDKMLNTELKKKGVEKRNLEKGITFFTETGFKGEELSDDQYKLMVLNHVTNYLTTFSDLPNYERTKEMLGSECSRRKEEKIRRLKSEIERLKREKEETEGIQNQLRADYEELYKAFVRSDDGDVDARSYFISQGSGLIKTMEGYAPDNKDSKLVNLEETITQKEAEMEYLKSMHPTSFKDLLLREVSSLKESLESLTRHASSDSYILVSPIISDPKKANEMARLMARYVTVYFPGKSLCSNLSLSEDLQRCLKKMLRSNRSCYLEKGDLVTNPDKLMGLVIDFERSFYKEKKFFEEYFVEDELLKLASDISCLDVGFFEKYKNALNEYDIPYLEELVAEENRVKGYFPRFFRFLVSEKIETAEQKTTSKKKAMRDSIKHWLNSHLDKETLGISNDIFFNNQYAVVGSLEICSNQITRREEAIKNIKSRVVEVQEERTRKDSERSSEKEKIIQEITALGGIVGEEDSMFWSKDVSNNLEHIAKEAAIHYMLDLVQRVEFVAKALAQLEEASIGSLPNIQAVDGTTDGDDSLGNSAGGYSLTKKI